MIVKRKIEYLCVFLLGGILYSLIEILWRGYTHWTMTAVGGLCFLALHIFNDRTRRRRLLTRCLVGSGMITIVEFLVGILVNVVFRLDVWDYSGMSCNIFGQVCLFFSCMWFLLCIPAFLLSSVITAFFQGIDL